MTYDVTFEAVGSSDTVLDVLERQNRAYLAAYETDAPCEPPALELTALDRARWAAVCAGFVRLLGPSEVEEFPSYVGIASDDPRVRLTYSGTSAYLCIPYWYGPDRARETLALVYAVGRLVEAETGLVGLDLQTGLDLGAEHLDAATALFVGTREGARRAIAEGT